MDTFLQVDMDCGKDRWDKATSVEVALAPTAAELKEFNIFLFRGKYSCYFKSPCPQRGFVVKHYMARPPPLEGRGLSNLAVPQAVWRGWGDER